MNAQAKEILTQLGDRIKSGGVNYRPSRGRHGGAMILLHSKLQYEWELAAPGTPFPPYKRTDVNQNHWTLAPTSSEIQRVYKLGHNAVSLVDIVTLLPLKIAQCAIEMQAERIETHKTAAHYYERPETSTVAHMENELAQAQAAMAD